MWGFTKDKEIDKAALKEKVILALKAIYDPEIPVNIYDLGLIYEVTIDDSIEASVKMTLTTPACPVAQTLPNDVENAVRAVEGINEAYVELVWDPPWTQEMMSEVAKVDLGMY